MSGGCQVSSVRTTLRNNILRLLCIDTSIYIIFVLAVYLKYFILGGFFFVISQCEKKKEKKTENNMYSVPMKYFIDHKRSFKDSLSVLFSLCRGGAMYV